MRSFASSTALVAISVLAPLVSAGVAAVVNNCETAFYLVSVGDQPSDQVILKNSRYVYNETYYSKKDRSGIAIKISGTPEASNNMTQFEYTMADPKVFYDISQINGNAIKDVDYTLTASDPDCPVVHCKANEPCTDVYNKWDDNQATHACDATADLIFTLCSSNTAPGDTADSSGAKDVQDGSEAAPKKAAFSAIGDSAADITVTPDGRVIENNKTPASTPSNDEGIVYVHPSWTTPAKRSIEEHLHQHTSHSRIRRSRVFRQ